ncbi:MAG TPA: preprotein translocase subunit SecE [Candidatus Faeciplasma pullistercoris]|uniref:Protein translocase subunit SecE n=1 Tax=Candidatus Faeciplasma pullistercoris TaxID=2840800 RepID=A0A9D1GTA0_9FIRM|nr:preprotein translocase subunit SecE [Candidatus Faeciplasma pullistercoris]
MKKPNKPNKAVKFFKDLVSEVKKVVWPDKKQVLNNTAVVLTVCVLSGVFLFIVNSVFGFILEKVIL